MSSINPYDIHRLDQALPEALADVDELANNPILRSDLNTKGVALAAMRWTADLADRHTHMGLAGAYVLATIRRIQEQEQADKLRAELAEAIADLRAALTERGIALSDDRPEPVEPDSLEEELADRMDALDRAALAEDWATRP